MKLFILLSAIVAANSNLVENNLTNVGVYLNKISSCNFNALTGNLLCASQEFETLIQYHSVNYIKMCPYHYCIKFYGEDKTISCSGYLLKLIGGNMDTYLNPLSTNIESTQFQGNSENIHKIGKPFLGYNVLIDSFIQNVQTTFDKNVVGIECKELHSTCVRFEGQSELECYGTDGFVFYDSSTSLIFGLLIPGVISAALYFLSSLICWKSVSRNYFTVFIITPMLVVVISLLILFQAERFIVKTHVFMIGSIFGIIIGYVTSSLLLKTPCFKKVNKNTVSQEEKVGLTDVESAGFSIESDDDDDTDEDEEKNDKPTLVTIELAKVK